MALPPLTPEQRAAALEKAAQARALRAELKQELKAGNLSVSEIIERSEKEEAIGKLKVISLLEALPGIGKATARAVMLEVGIAQSRRVRGLGPHQRSALVERFG